MKRMIFSCFLVGVVTAHQSAAAQGNPFATYVVTPEIIDCIDGWEMPVRVNLPPTPLNEFGITWITDDDTVFADNQRRTDGSPTSFDISQDVVDRAIKDSDYIKEMAPKLAVELNICTSPFGTRAVHGNWSLDGASELYTFHLEGKVEKVSETMRARTGTLSVVLDQEEVNSLEFVFRAVELPFDNFAPDGDDMLVALNFFGQVPVVPRDISDKAVPKPSQSETLALPDRPFALVTSALQFSFEFRELSAQNGPPTGQYVLLKEPNEECDPTTEYPMLTRIENLQALPRLNENHNKRVLNTIERSRINDFWQTMSLSVDAEILGCFGFGEFRLTETAIVLKGEAPGHVIDYKTQWNGPFDGDEGAQHFVPRYEASMSHNGKTVREGPYPLMFNRLENLSVPVLDTAGPKLLRPRPVDLNFSFIPMPDTSLTPQLLQEITK